MTRYRSLRERVADLYRRSTAERGIDPSISPDQVAVMTFAMANGLALEKLLEPEVVTEDTFGTMLLAFFGGLAATSEAPSGAGHA